MIKTFVKNFIKEKYQDRILFELTSNNPNKREKAFTKLLDYSEYFKNNLRKEDLTHKTDEEILNVVKSKFLTNECFSLKYERTYELSKAILNAINSYMIDILIIDDKNIIYIGEVADHNDGGSASIKFIGNILNI